MKYLVRSIKYFFYFAFLTSLIIFALVFVGMADSNIENNFQGGADAFWKIGIFYILVAAVYPKLGFINRKLYIDASLDVEADMISFLEERRYVLESRTDDTMTFRLRGLGQRLVKMNEDRITITRSLDGYYMEGLRKDVLRLASGMEYKFLHKED
ncbi:MAG: hypothetical protein E7115_00875 [Bacteroidales bacterium]|nr:hypothetical protein [Bacteroidales bacterium]